MRVMDKAEALASFRRRGFSFDEDARRVVTDILREVEERGDRALLELTARLDGVDLDEIAVPQADLAAAERRLDATLRRDIDLAIERVRDYYRHQPEGGFLHQADGALLGQLVRPLERVGCYVPGGRAGTTPLFSSLIMTAVPARVAGVRHLVAATPPRRDGSVAPEVLYVARRLELDAVYRIGGAQAVAALAYGTESVTRVDKIVGPGSRFVVLAKQAVFGRVGIEALPGPTETLLLADDDADVGLVVADLLAQAEHDGAQPVLVTPSARLAEAVALALPHALEGLPTAATARDSVEQRGVVVRVDSLADGLEVANAYAPEHLCLLVRDPWSLVSRVEHAGGIFIGERSLEALGDYLAGPSHVMPTGGTARFASFVNLRDFQKVIPLLSVGEELLGRIGPPAARLARAEGLEAHARAIEARLAGD